MKTSHSMHSLSIKALTASLAFASLSMGASASMLFTFDTDPLDARPLGYKYINTPAGTSVQVIGTSSGIPFPAENVHAIQLIDQSTSGAPVVSFQGTDKYVSGVASFDFNFVRDTTFTNTGVVIRLGAGGTSGNISTAANIAAQVSLSVKSGGGQPVGMGVSISDSATGALLDLDQRFEFNTAYRMEIGFLGGDTPETNLFTITVVDAIGNRTALTRGGISEFEYRAGIGNEVAVDTLWFQAGNAANASSSIYIDNVRMIPEPGMVSLAMGGLVAFAALKRFAKRGASSDATK